ncbi:Fur family transcriptional regulator [Streptomyces sp. CNQ085]|uniref:Fur family transcriptional regulator n=1 Tax=Streptomyces sp. CNQ085 TaxID=2886944 RepID=UPI001FFCE791|nr:transcriptional repressor [Streptomyces sp. CNQ085]MCI0385675.1 transcriptional repressor [Streptomyces sp. CNQ085]
MASDAASPTGFLAPGEGPASRAPQEFRATQRPQGGPRARKEQAPPPSCGGAAPSARTASARAPERRPTARTHRDAPADDALRAPDRWSPLPGTRRRQATVLRLLEGLEVFAGARQIHRRLQRQGDPVSLSTVYRALAALERLGLVDVVRDGSGGKAYRYRDTTEHRHYLVCRDCGYNVPVPCREFEEWLAATQRRYGFADVRHMLVFEGRCRKCLDERTA